ncbi:MAG: amino acid ABC transporter permease, partial [Anaerolineae bacterium]|nr:amino acid ABC transporter permease [Anaerolineae bacterium]
TTSDKFDVVYEVNTEVQVIQETLTLRLPDDTRLNIAISDAESREEGRLVCDRQINPDCIDQFGELVTFRAPAGEEDTPAGTMEKRGALSPEGGLFTVVNFSDGSSTVVDPTSIINREEGTLQCNHILQPDCQDLSGEIVTLELPYVLKQGLLLREDAVILHPDGYVETVRPNRLSNVETRECEEEATCFGGVYMTAQFRERVVGTEISSEGDNLKIRTVNEQKVFIPRDRIISMEAGLVECDRDANPRCQDFEGSIIQQQGAITAGELTLETNRAISIIPDGQTTAVEIPKVDLIQEEEVRSPENCRVEEEGACFITVKAKDSVVAGQIVEDTDEGITVQTVAPVFVELDPESANSTRRAPLGCALNNIRGCNAGIWLTLLVTFVAYGLALMIGLFVGLMRVSSNPVIYHLSTFHVELIRGTPLLVLLLFFAFVIGPTIRDMKPIDVGLFEFSLGGFYDLLNDIEVAVLGEESFLSEAVLGLAIGYGAFLAEVFRAGIQSVGRGQMEAARSLGMSYPQAMRHVILPQAIRVVLPPLGNDFIALLKDSALISVLALPDLLQLGRLYVTRTFQPIPVYIVVSLLYVLLTLVLSMMVRYIERRFRLP